MKEKLLSLLFCLLIFNLVYAQEGIEELKIPERIQRSNFTAFGGGSLSNFVSNVSLSSTFNQGQNGKLELRYNKKWVTAGVSVDQKISKQSQATTPFDLNGISPGTTVEFNLQKMFWDPVVRTWAFNLFQEAKRTYAARNKIADTRGITVMDISKNGSAMEKRVVKNILKLPVFFNARYSFTKSEFTYVKDSATLRELNEVFITPAFTFSLGFPLGASFSFNSFVAFSYNYSINYSASDELTILSPFGSSGNYVSQTVTFGAPLKRTDNRLSAEWRVNVGIKETGEKTLSIGLAPSATLGLTSDRLAVTLPIYFINGVTKEGKPSGLQSGVKFGYFTSLKPGLGNSFKEGFGAQLIITIPFEVLGKLPI